MKLPLILAVIAILFEINRPVPGFPPPPGTMEIGDNAYIDKQLITYLDYQEFLFSIKTRDSVLYRQMIPDDTLVTYKKKVLWNNSDFQDFPVLGLNEKQMTAYSAWRSDAVNQMIFNRSLRCSNFKYWETFDALDPDKKYKVAYSIPAKAEIQGSTLKKEKYHPDEWASDGIVPGKQTDKISNSALRVFRCKAMYVPVK